MSKFKDEVRSGLTEIKVELSKNSEILNQHHVRTSNLEARLKPIENHVILMSTAFKILATVGSAVAVSASVYHYLLK